MNDNSEMSAAGKLSTLLKMTYVTICLFVSIVYGLGVVQAFHEQKHLPVILRVLVARYLARSVTFDRKRNESAQKYRPRSCEVLPHS